ncbi:GRB10-interacting GYF protein 1 isoform X3 [Paramormyrops kingsleyae]|uniref:GRB10 interacting GYF protein 1 n=1 Tax=Paramormyrops kingsleyae TaxID=1676925 RepID=A0A3B3R5U8_9TELE|nr:GRB10-interacting GYF protein 1 isoform X3 [Paramormyrops kingsleyae]
MTAETLNFGPEWLRALSSGGSVASPPPSPAMPKYKLAEYRYGREEMLALYIKDNKVPEDMQDKEFSAILQDEPLEPLALVPLTEEEQRNFSMSVNSVAVLRLMGKGGGAIPAGATRGRGSTRGGRGRGRGDSGFYQRSIEDGEGSFGRSVREIHRSQSWDDRGERRFEKPPRRDGVRVAFDETGTGARKDHARADSENWRTLREEQEEEETTGEPAGSWRVAGTRRDDGGPRSAGWREHTGPGEGRRRKFEFDFREHSEGGRRRAGSEGLEDERDGLPEWCTDEEDGEMGTFDSSGAFLSIKKGSTDPIPEEKELEFQGLEEEDESSLMRPRKDSGEDTAEEKEVPLICDGEAKSAVPPSPPSVSTPASSVLEPHPHPPELEPPQVSQPPSAPQPAKASKLPSEDGVTTGGAAQMSPSSSSSLPSSPPSSAATDLPPPGGDTEDDEGMKHLQQEAEKMVASLQDEESFSQTLQERCNTAAALPLSHEAAMKWFYKDPQGEIQGPFTPQEMSEWFQVGYFSMTLLVKRGCDEGFQPLGDVIKMWGRVPFAPGPSPPPLLVRQPLRPGPPRGPAGNLDQERLKKQQELAAAAALFQQLQQQQQLFQLINRCGDQGMMPSMSRSMSVPDTGSMWDMHTSASQQSGGEASLWDLTMNSSTQGPTLEQLQKLQQERRDAELRAKREEEERKRREEKRRQQEEQKRREEEELYRRKQQCRQQQELILKLLQQTQQQASQVGSGWSGGPAVPLAKPGKPLSVLELQQEAERQLLKQQRAQQQQRERHGGMSLGNPGVSALGGQWSDGPGGLWASSGMEAKSSGSSLGLWDEAVKSQASLRNMGLKTSRSSPSLSEPYLLNRRKRTEEEDKLLKLLQGMKPQDGFTTWCEQMLHALNTSANNTTSSFDVATIVAYLKEVESPYDVLDFIRSYLGDTVEAKEFAKQFLERRAKQKANHQRQQQQLSKEVAGLTMNFPIQDSMRGVNPTLQSMFQAAHMGKGGVYDGQGSKMKKKQSMMLHSDPSILGYSFHSAGDRLSVSEMEMVEEY